MSLNMNVDFFVRFYTSCGKQYMWIEKEWCDGMRCEVDSFEDVKNSFAQYMTQTIDKNKPKINFIF